MRASAGQVLEGRHLSLPIAKRIHLAAFPIKSHNRIRKEEDASEDTDADV